MPVKDAQINRQAAMVAYVDVFRLMCVVTLVLAPLLLLVRPPTPGQSEDLAMVE